MDFDDVVVGNENDSYDESYDSGIEGEEGCWSLEAAEEEEKEEEEEEEEETQRSIKGSLAQFLSQIPTSTKSTLRTIETNTSPTSTSTLSSSSSLSLQQKQEELEGENNNPFCTYIYGTGSTSSSSSSTASPSPQAREEKEEELEGSEEEDAYRHPWAPPCTYKHSPYITSSRIYELPPSTIPQNQEREAKPSLSFSPSFSSFTFLTPQAKEKEEEEEEEGLEKTEDIEEVYRHPWAPPCSYKHSPYIYNVTGVPQAKEQEREQEQEEEVESKEKEEGDTLPPPSQSSSSPSPSSPSPTPSTAPPSTPISTTDSKGNRRGLRIDCSICYVEGTVGSGLDCPCGQLVSVCVDCWSSILTSHLNSGLPLGCFNCGWKPNLDQLTQTLEPRDGSASVNPEVVNHRALLIRRYAAQLLIERIQRNPDLFSCSLCGLEVHKVSSTSVVGYCSRCKIFLCPHCGYPDCERMTSTPSRPCSEPLILSSTSSSSSSSLSLSPSSSSSSSSRRDRRRLQRRTRIKECPNCSVPTERVDGCYHIICTQCNHQYCWGCSRRLGDGHTSRCRYRNSYKYDILLLISLSPFILIWGIFAIPYYIVDEVRKERRMNR